MGYIFRGQYRVIFWEQLLVYPAKGTQICPLIMEWFWENPVSHFSGRKAEEEAEKQRKIDEEKKA